MQLVWRYEKCHLVDLLFALASKLPKTLLNNDGRRTFVLLRCTILSAASYLAMESQESHESCIVFLPKSVSENGHTEVQVLVHLLASWKCDGCCLSCKLFHLLFVPERNKRVYLSFSCLYDGIILYLEHIVPLSKTPSTILLLSLHIACRAGLSVAGIPLLHDLEWYRFWACPIGDLEFMKLATLLLQDDRKR